MKQGRLLRAAFALAVVFLGVACDDSGGNKVTPTAELAATALPTPTAEPPRDLGSEISPRANVPEADPFDLAVRYGISPGRPPASKPGGPELAMGSVRQFNVARISGVASGPPPVPTSITAVLRAKTAHALFYVDRDVAVSQSAADAAVEFFESTTWPKVTTIFGAPPDPGIDGDPRVVILQADLGGVGGYMSPEDLLPREIRPLSNEADMIYMDETSPFGGTGFNTIVAHELQHLIHERDDAGEEAWINEGLSETAYGLVGGQPTSTGAFTPRPSTQLNGWSFSSNLAHYGAASAFLRYVADRFGGDPALGDIAREPGDGPAGIDQFLKSKGESLTFHDIFADWITANVLDDDSGPYANRSWDIKAAIDGEMGVGDAVDESATQFGTDYYRLSGVTSGQAEIRFSGAPVIDVLPTSPSKEGAFWWSNRGDQIDTTLTREVTLPATGAVLRFVTWYDIERWYDRGYVSVSTDGGRTWKPQHGTASVTDDPVRILLGEGWQGTSGDPLQPRWIDEQVDLSAYAGQRVQVRFEYVTDGGTHGEGWAIDDVRIDGTDLADMQASQPGWQSNGWVRIDGTLPQRWVVRLIGRDKSGASIARDVPLDATNRGSLRFDASEIVDPVLAIAGATEGTNLEAPYHVELRQP